MHFNLNRLAFLYENWECFLHHKMIWFFLYFSSEKKKTVLRVVAQRLCQSIFETFVNQLIKRNKKKLIFLNRNNQTSKSREKAKRSTCHSIIIISPLVIHFVHISFILSLSSNIPIYFSLSIQIETQPNEKL